MKLDIRFKACVLAICFSIYSLASGQIPMPEHSSPTLGGAWICDAGYERVGFTCQEIDLPDNARFYGLGNYWRCVRGYKKSGNQCQRVFVPANAKLTIMGDDWVCNEGYFAAGFKCIAETTDEPNDFQEPANT